MRRGEWSEVADEVTEIDDEEKASARRRAEVHMAAALRALDGFALGRGGRCPYCNVKPHPQAVKCCGRKLRRHG